jgi:hypothetical protein
VTIAVKAVPPNRREYTFPNSPTAKAPIADTTSDLLKMKWFAVLFAANEMHEMITMTTRSQERQGWRLPIELRTENAGTVIN